MESALQGASDNELDLLLEVCAHEGGNLAGLDLAEGGERGIGQGVIEADVVGAAGAREREK